MMKDLRPTHIAETALYVADLGAERTYAYAILPDGRLDRKRLFCSMGSDGMTLDADGRLYLTHKTGVSVFGPAGTLLGVIPIPES